MKITNRNVAKISMKRAKVSSKMPVHVENKKNLGVGVRIIALTPVGKKALEAHERDRMKEPWVQRKVFDGLYQERVLAGPPMVVEILHKNAKVAHLIPFESMSVPIRDSMLENGAVINIDYKLEKVGP